MPVGLKDKVTSFWYRGPSTELIEACKAAYGAEGEKIDGSDEALARFWLLMQQALESQFQLMSIRQDSAFLLGALELELPMEARAQFKSDISVITHFTYALLKRPWRGFSQPEDKARYESILHCLLEVKRPSIRLWPGLTYHDIRRLKRALNEYQQLIDFCLRDGRKSATILEALRDWWADIILMMRGFIRSRVTPQDALYDEIAEQVFQLINKHPSSDKTKQGESLKVLSNWYTGAAEYYAQQALWYQRFSCDSMESRLRQLTPSFYINQVITSLADDLAKINRLGQYRLKAMWVYCSNDADTQMERYLEVYQRTDKALRQWRESAFKIRMALEQVFRGSNRHYLSYLSELDSRLVGLYDESVMVQARWLEMTSDYASQFRSELCSANDYLGAMHQGTQALEAVHWLHQTCYEYHGSEGLVTYELDRRNEGHEPRYFKSYHLEHAYTISDYAVDCLDGNIKGVLQLIRRIHPDKQSGEALKRVAGFCTEQLTHLHAEAVRFSKIWKDGQWVSVGLLRPEADVLLLTDGECNDATASECGFKPLPSEEIEQIEKPRQGLGLSILALHQAYVQRMTSKQFNLNKRAKGYARPEQALYDAEPEGTSVGDFYRPVWAISRMAASKLYEYNEETAQEKSLKEAAESEKNAALKREEDALKRAEDALKRAEDALEREKALKLDQIASMKIVMRTFIQQSIPNSSEDEPFKLWMDSQQAMMMIAFPTVDKRIVQEELLKLLIKEFHCMHLTGVVSRYRDDELPASSLIASRDTFFGGSAAVAGGVSLEGGTLGAYPKGSDGDGQRDFNC